LQPGGASPGATAMRCDSFLAGEERGGATPGVAIKISPASKTSPRDASGLVDDVEKTLENTITRVYHIDRPRQKANRPPGEFSLPTDLFKANNSWEFSLSSNLLLEALVLLAQLHVDPLQLSSFLDHFPELRVQLPVRGSGFRVQGSGSRVKFSFVFSFLFALKASRFGVWQSFVCSFMCSIVQG